MSAVLVDAGPMVAAFARSDPNKARCRKLLEQAHRERWALLTTWPCVVEASHLLDPPQRYAMLRWVASPAITVSPLDGNRLELAVQLMKKWSEPPRSEMDLADAALVILAEELNTNRIVTLDPRDFSRYRLSDGRAFEIL